MHLRRTTSGCLLVLAGAPSSAFAFTIDTRVSDGCHERLAVSAIEVAGWPGAQSPPALDEYHRLILEDLPFAVPAQAHDPWSIALLIGVRHNDLAGVAPSDLPGLSEIHNDPRLQSEHCLRGPRDDGPEGDAGALLACRSFILRELGNALGAGEDIDLVATVSTEVNLAFRGEIEVELQRFGFHLGRALHALHDSYSHAFRAPSDERVRHVLNFVDPARESDYSEVRDGHEHVARLDDCSDRAVAPRFAAAEVASIELLEAVMESAGGRAGRIARIQAVLDRSLAREEGCTAANRWCDAPELTLVSECHCQSVEASPSLPVLGGLFVLVFVFWRLRRPIMVTSILLLLFTGSAMAFEGGDSPPTPGGLGFHLAGSAAIDRGAFAITGGLRYRVFDRLSLGLDLEHNPWFSIDAAELAPGAVNLYATGIIHWVAFDGLELRSTAHVGTSFLLFDLVGAEAGSAGLYFGLSMLGLGVQLREDLQLIFEPADLAFPIPHLSGVPYYYRQYRVTLGLQWNP